jgi:DNA repair exonuclease SbcCD ATPase subunit
VQDTEEATKRLDALRAEIDAANAENTSAVQQADEARIARDAALVELGKTQAVTARAKSEHSDVQSQLDETTTLLEAAKRDVLMAETRAKEISQQAGALIRSTDEKTNRLAEQTQQAESLLADLIEEQAVEEARLEALLARIEQAKAELAGIESPLPPEAVQPSAAALTPQSPQPLARGTAKPASAVSVAMQQAPGLETATEQQQQALQNLLIRGVCAHEALQSVFETVNRQTLLSLSRSLGRC